MSEHAGELALNIWIAVGGTGALIAYSYFWYRIGHGEGQNVGWLDGKNWHKKFAAEALEEKIARGELIVRKVKKK